MTESHTTGLSYKQAGVDIEAGEDLVNRIKSVSKKTKRPEVLNDLGGFGALCSIPKNIQEPILVAGTDGVGTKLRLAIDLEKHNTVGIDLVAMCVNDLIVQGAAPLFFLDYYATAKLDVDVAKSVVEGIGEGCLQANCSLIGGETAEMPGMYQTGDYDLAGFCVGVVDKKDIIDGSNVQIGDRLIAIASSGPHSNGYSLIRKVLEFSKADLKQKINDKMLYQLLIEPTKIYVKSILTLLENHTVNAIAHITGGGLLENIPRVLPEKTLAEINTSSWQWPEIFNWLQQQGNIAEEEMYRTFNCGVGMVLSVPNEDSNAIISVLNELGESAWDIGQIKSSEQSKPTVKMV